MHFLHISEVALLLCNNFRKEIWLKSSLTMQSGTFFRLFHCVNWSMKKSASWNILKMSSKIHQKCPIWPSFCVSNHNFSRVSSVPFLNILISNFPLWKSLLEILWSHSILMFSIWLQFTLFSLLWFRKMIELLTYAICIVRSGSYLLDKSYPQGAFLLRFYARFTELIFGW